jgi:hypothetical protein
MTNSVTCRYAGDRDETLVEYLYGEMDAAARTAFEAHLSACFLCAEELHGLRGVRRHLAAWAPPESGVAFEHAPAASAGMWARVQAMPAWAQAAAAILCIGVGLGAANLQLQYGPEGLSVRTGWLAPAAVRSESSAPAREVWRIELTALEQELRAEIARSAVSQTTVAAAPAADASGGSEVVLRQIRNLIGQSEQRQERELALRLGDLMKDVEAQRRADLSRIDRSIGLVQNSTGLEVMRQREMLNTLAVRVSQRP